MSLNAHATQPDLPSELWSRIILYASLLDPPDAAVWTLHALAQVNRDFQAISTSLLYRDVVLNTPERQRSFWRTISHHPNLWWNVRNIILGERDWPNDPRYNSSTTRTLFRRPSPRLTQLGEAISTGSLRWSESFQLTAHCIPALPIGLGPDPSLLEEVSWWEQAPVGGLLCGHSYSTREEGDWCHPVEWVRLKRKEREKARTVEDVDLGQGPGRRAVSSVERGDREGEQQPQPFGLDEVDVWAAAERFASESLGDGQKEQHAKTDTIQLTTSPPSWPSIPPHLKPRHKRIPWRYSLITGYLDPNLPKLFESIGTLQVIQLTLYPGTLLDHDLLEHQLRLLLDTNTMPILRRLDVHVGHDSISIGSRLARITHSKVVQLAVERVDDPRCKIFSAERTYGGGGAKGDSSKDVREQVGMDWNRGVCGQWKVPPGDDDQGSVVGKKWVNAWLQRDVSGDPIQE